MLTKPSLINCIRKLQVTLFDFYFYVFSIGFPASGLEDSVRSLLVDLMKKCDKKNLGAFYISLIAGMTTDIQQGTSSIK